MPQRMGHVLTGGGGGGAGLLGGLPRRCSVCVIYPFWKIQTYKCVCCKARADGGHRLPNKANRIPLTSPRTLVGFNLCRFQPKQIKGRYLSFSQGSASIIPLSSALSTRNPGRERPGRKVSLSSRVSEPDTVTLSINEAETPNSESLNF